MSSSPTIPKEDEADIPEEMAAADKNTAAEAGSSSMLTSAMLEEEDRLHQETVTQEEELRKHTTQPAAPPQDAEAEDDVVEQRYNRLKFLLSKSNMYTSYLVKRMERQTQDEQRSRERRERRLHKEMERQKLRQQAQAEKASQAETTEEQPDNIRSRRSKKSEPSSAELRSPRSRRSAAQPPASSPTASLCSPRGSRSNKNSPRVTNSNQESNKESPSVSSRRGRKRKAENLDNYRIADYYDKALAATKNENCDEDGEVAPAAKKHKASEQAESQPIQKVNSTEVAEPKSTVKAEQKTHETKDIPAQPTEDQAKLDRIVTDITADQTEEDEDAPVPDRYINGELVHPDQPSLLSGGVLRPYQVEGFNWLKVIYENGINGILADEMGLGKTIQCIAAVSYLVQQGVPGPYLVCAPLSTVPNWVAEFARFAPQIPCILYHGTKDERQALRSKVKKLHHVVDDIRTYPVVVTSYEITMNDRAHMMNYAWKYIIVDEGHRIKNFQCRLIRELKQYRSTHRLLLTGTPLQNNLAELWSLLNFLLPEIFDDLTSFETWFDLDSLQTEDGHSRIVAEEKRKNILGMLHQILTPFMLRRLKTDVDLVIPPKREVLVYAPLTAKQEKYYRAAVDHSIKSLVKPKKEFKVEVLTDASNQSPCGRQQRKAAKQKINYKLMMGEDGAEDVEAWAEALSEMKDKQQAGPVKTEEEGVPESDTNIKVRNIVMLLRKACNHPYLLEYPLTKAGDFRIDDDIVKASGKFMLLDRMLPELHKRGHKVLIFSQMTSILDIIGDYSYMRGWMYSRLDGSMHVTDRKIQMDHFTEDPNVFLFLLSTRAGGLGINLTAADTVIIFDSDWNPQADLQAQDRCHRIGQTRPVLIYRLITANTIDQKIVERAAAKRRLEKMVMLKGKFKDGIRQFHTEIKAINPMELLQLLKSRDYDAEVRGREGQVISNRELENLLDRSDLVAAYEQRKAGKDPKNMKTEMADIEGVYKVVNEDISGGLDGDKNSQADPTSGDTDVNHNEPAQPVPVAAV